MATTKRTLGHSEVADIALEALALAQGHRRAPERQDVLDAIQMEMAGKRCGKRRLFEIEKYGWSLTLRLWWRQRCVPDWAAGLPVGPTVQDGMGSAGDAAPCV
jgi:hypothetical protein